MDIKKLKERLVASKLFKDSFWALFGNSVGKVLMLAVGIIIANLLGSEQYGQYGMIKSTLLYVSIFSTFGLGITGTKFIAQHFKDFDCELNQICKDITYVTLCTSLIIAGIVFIFANPFARYLDVPEMKTILRITSVAIVFNALNTMQIGVLGGFKKFKVTSTNSIITGLYTCFSGFLFTYFWGLQGAVIALSSSYVFGFFLNEFHLRKLRQKFPQPTGKTSYKKEMILFSLPIALQEGLLALTNWLTIIILIKISNYSELGVYSAASVWMSAISFVPAILKNVTLSYLSDPSIKHHSIVNKMVIVNLVSTGLMFLIILLFSGLISKMYGPSFTGIQSVLNILVLSTVIGSIGSVYIQELISLSKNWLSFVITLVKSVLILVLGYAMTIHVGTGASVSFAVAALIANIVYLVSLIFTYRGISKNV